LAQLDDARLGAVVEAFVDHVALGTMHARDDRPGRVVVRRHLLGRPACRGVKREAMVGILAQAIDAAVGTERRLLLREEVGAACQRSQKAADFLEIGGVHTASFDVAGLVDQLPHGLCALLMLVHLSLRSAHYSGRTLAAPSRVNLRWGDETVRSARRAG